MRLAPIALIALLSSTAAFADEPTEVPIPTMPVAGGQAGVIQAVLGAVEISTGAIRRWVPLADGRHLQLATELRLFEGLIVTYPEHVAAFTPQAAVGSDVHRHAIIQRRLGSKRARAIFADGTTVQLAAK